MCQFLIGKVQQNGFGDVHQQSERRKEKCQFLIGKVQPLTTVGIGGDNMNNKMCQFLIGKVQQPFSSASIHILFFFSHIIKLFHQKSPSTFTSTSNKKRYKSNAFS